MGYVGFLFTGCSQKWRNSARNNYKIPPSNAADLPHFSAAQSIRRHSSIPVFRMAVKNFFQHRPDFRRASAIFARRGLRYCRLNTFGQFDRRFPSRIFAPLSVFRTSFTNQLPPAPSKMQGAIPLS